MFSIICFYPSGSGLSRTSKHLQENHYRTPDRRFLPVFEMTIFAVIRASAAPLSDPSGSSALVDAARWINDALLGTIATSIAVVAVALVGFAMLSGRVHWRRGLMVIFGCFLLFGARSIVGGLVPQGEVFVPMVSAPSPPPVGPPPENQGYDPYAGAAPARN